MTEAKGIRVPMLTCDKVVFTDPVSVLLTDLLELDFRRKQARVVSAAGKVKAITTFKAEGNGPEATAGS